MTPEIERLIDNEAYRRARGDHIDDRIPTKILAKQTGFTKGYLGNLIAMKRREHEKKIHITAKCEILSERHN